MTTTLSPLERLDSASDLIGYIPEDIRDYLEWVLLMCTGPARDELVRLLNDMGR